MGADGITWSLRGVGGLRGAEQAEGSWRCDQSFNRGISRCCCMSLLCDLLPSPSHIHPPYSVPHSAPLLAVGADVQVRWSRLLGPRSTSWAAAQARGLLRPDARSGRSSVHTCGRLCHPHLPPGRGRTAACRGRSVRSGNGCRLCVSGICTASVCFTASV